MGIDTLQRIAVRVFLAGGLALGCASSARVEGDVAEDDVVWRAPFTLRLQIDGDRYYREEIDEIPYVHRNDVYLFSGESFGVDVSIRDGGVHRLVYREDAEEADIGFQFRQERMSSGELAMLLVMRSRLEKRVYLDALMTVPGEKGVYKTGIVPLGPGMSNYESWPHPIVQLFLTNFRLEE